MKTFKDLKKEAEEIIREEIEDKGRKILVTRLKEIRALERLLKKARSKLEDLLEKDVDEVVDLD